MSRRLERRHVGPFIVLVLAGLMAFGATISMRGTRPLQAPLDLRLGATSTFELRPSHSDRYFVGVEMNGQEAQRLLPCLADYASPSYGHCGPEQPIQNLSLHVQAIDGAAPLALGADTSRAGGEFSTGTFTRPIAYTYLEAGKSYRLTVTSPQDGTFLGPTAPRLVVAMEAISHKERGLTAMLVTLLALIAGMVAIVWAALAARSGRQPVAWTADEGASQL